MGKVLFRLGLLGALVSICVSAYLFARAQGGPSWEVPASVMRELQTLPPLVFALAIAASGLYAWSRHVAGGRARRGMVILLAIAVILPWIIWLFHPEQWPYQFVALSMAATILFVPTVLAALFLFWLIGFRWLKR
jgi:hypothetical protein